MKGLKLYYWDKVLKNWTFGCAFALAENVEQAREMIVQRYKEDSIKDIKNNYPKYSDEMIKETLQENHFYIGLFEELKAEPQIIDTKSAFYCEGGA